MFGLPVSNTRPISRVHSATLSAWTITGADAASFDFVDVISDETLQPGESLEVLVQFAPLTPQESYSATVEFDATNDAAAAEFMVELMGSNPAE